MQPAEWRRVGAASADLRTSGGEKITTEFLVLVMPVYTSSRVHTGETRAGRTSATRSNSEPCDRSRQSIARDSIAYQEIPIILMQS